jgi:hypothetical protein
LGTSITISLNLSLGPMAKNSENKKNKKQAGRKNEQGI